MSRKAVEDEEKRIKNTLTEWTVEKFLDMRKELLDRQKDLEKSNLEMVEKLRSSDEKFVNLSNDVQSKLDKIIETLKPEASSKILEKVRLSDEKMEKLSKKFDSIQSKLNKIDKTLKPVVSSEIGKLSEEHQEKFDSIQWKLTEIEKTLHPEVWSEIVEKIKLSDEKIEKLSKYHREKLDSIQLKLNEIDNTPKPDVSSEIQKLSKEHQENFDWIQLKLHKIEKTLKPEVSSKIEENNDPETSGKYFVLKHTFNNISSFQNDEIRYTLFLWNSLLKNTEKKWEIEVEFELKIVSSVSKGKKEKIIGKICRVFKSDGSSSVWVQFIKWDELEKDFVVDDCFCFEIAVKVRKMTGIYKENLRSFDKTMEEYSDVVLIVNNERFYVLKLILATDSSYFKTLFMEKSNETEKTEIQLSGIDADDFQKYLEVLYGKQAIDEFNVEGILKFLYNLFALMKKCIEEIK